MPIKDVLVHLDPDQGSAPRLDAAIRLALAFGARLAAFVPVVQPVAPLVALPPERLFRERRDAEADGAVAAAAARAAAAGVALEGRRETAQLEELPELFACRARHADIVIVGRPGAGPDADGLGVPALSEAAFLATGRPALVLPPSGARALPPGHALVAWDGSREAARAVHDALPLLRRTTRVSTLVVAPENLGDRVGDGPGADLAAHLARHGLKVELTVLPDTGRRTGEVLLARAEEEGADLLVMGAYGHARLRELVLGGATRHALAHATMPVLLSH